MSPVQTVYVRINSRVSRHPLGKQQDSSHYGLLARSGSCVSATRRAIVSLDAFLDS